MIFESVRLEHVGPFANEAWVENLTMGLNILAANNEAGKTTLIRAATRALFDRHTCADQEIKMLQPAGAGTAPAVTLVFQTGGETYKLEKRFLNKPKCELSRRRNNAWELIENADKADARTSELLKAELAQRGASKEMHWGLLRYLWARQGEAAALPTWDRAIGKMIKDRLAKLEIDAWVDGISAGLKADYDAQFTEKGVEKAGSELKTEMETLAAIDNELTGIETRTRELETLRKKYATHSADVSRLDTEQQDRKMAADAARELAAETERRLSELALKQQARDRCLAELKTIAADEQAQVQHTAELTQRRNELASTEQDLTTFKQRQEEIQAQLELAGRELGAAEIGQAALQTQAKRVRELLGHRRLAADHASLAQFVGSILEQEKLRKALELKLAALPEITRASLDGLSSLRARIETRGKQLEAQALTVELIPERDSAIEITHPGDTRAQTLKAKMATTLRAPQRLELTLEGWGTLSVRSGAEEVRKIVEALSVEKAQFEQELAALRLKSPDEGATILEQRLALQKQLDAVVSAVSALRNSQKISGDIEQELARSEARLNGNQQRLAITPDENARASAELEAGEQRLAVEEKELARRLTEQKKSESSARKNLDAIGKQLAASKTQEAVLKEKIETLAKQIAERDARYPRGIAQSKAEAESVYVGADAELNDAKRKMPPDYEKYPERNKRAAQALAEVEKDLRNAREALNTTQGELKALGSEGLYSRETALRERKAGLEEIVAARRAHARMARLVHELIHRRKQAATNSVLGPLESGLSHVFAEITGDFERRVFLDTELKIRGVGRNEAELIAFENLSQGAREQLMLAVRLAVAKELSQDEPQLLILDDVLVNTDATRQTRILELLQGAERLQILILTCHPERYRGIGTPVQLQSN